MKSSLQGQADEEMTRWEGYSGGSIVSKNKKIT